ncbi:ABC transporter ATP-binding protein [Bifidobacterium dolichotidis]|uniref:ABC transporter ATP-binding protein n=1 Tax=Bifidobacterium dolichotidis TaxID=2306976 RepID=A0A430FSA0_9BIFI|nr:ABC transporter ATP-binding protein [Bifidobacterium dolichotidis]RSX55756.1 ABC transporter ATP-binding protein [Bifidobacterium dolichotidis]
MDATTPTPMAVTVQHLVKRYGTHIALNDLDLHVNKREIFGLLGPNGSGKTTAINCILGLLSYDSGSIHVFGQELTPANYALKRRIGVVPQDVAVFNELTVLENIRYFCSLYINDRKQRNQLVDEAIAFVGLDDYRKFRPKALSGGLLRRLNIACGIVHRPDLIFFDEPTVAVDPQSRNAILDGIQELNRQGATIIYTSHYMEEVEQLCNRIEIIDHGTCIALGTAEALKNSVQAGERIVIEAPALAEHPDLQTSVLQRLRALPFVIEVQYANTELTVEAQRGEHNLVDVLSVLHNDGIPVGHVSARPPTLNDVFLELTGTELRD